MKKYLLHLLITLLGWYLINVFIEWDFNYISLQSRQERIEFLAMIAVIVMIITIAFYPKNNNNN